jgi:plastocyanin
VIVFLHLLLQGHPSRPGAGDGDPTPSEARTAMFGKQARQGPRTDAAMWGRPATRVVLAFVCAVVFGLLSACGGSSGGSSGSSGGAASGSSAAGSGSGSSADTITIKDFAFTTPTSVAPGTTITVKNEDGTAHTVTADKGDAFNSPAPAGNSSFTAPTEPGTYAFHCNIHPEMHGTLVVK